MAAVYLMHTEKTQCAPNGTQQPVLSYWFLRDIHYAIGVALGDLGL